MDDENIIVEDTDDAGYDETGFEGEESILELDDNEADESDGDEQVDSNPTLTFQIYHGRIRNKFDDLPAMEQAVDKILRTERFVYPIYTDQYGNDLYDLIGQDIDYAKVEAKRMIKEALEDDDRVIDVTIDSVEPKGRTKLKVYGTCTTVYGDIPIENEVRLKDESK